VADAPYTAAEVDAAIAALQQPERLAHAQEVVTHAAPTLPRVLAEALSAGGWFGSAHDSEVTRVSVTEDAHERETAVRTLVAEETRLSMLVGVAVGFGLAHELRDARHGTGPDARSEPGGNSA